MLVTAKLDEDCSPDRVIDSQLKAALSGNDVVALASKPHLLYSVDVPFHAMMAITSLITSP